MPRRLPPLAGRLAAIKQEMGSEGIAYQKRSAIIAAGKLPRHVSWSLCATMDLAWLNFITSKDDLRVYLCLTAHMTARTRESWPGKDRISREVGVYVSNVRKAFRTLAAVGAIETERRRDDAGDEMTSRHRLPRHPISEDDESRTAFVALDWVRRIHSVKALRVFVALCAHADFTTSRVHGVSRQDLARETGLHVSDVPKALRELQIMHAITMSAHPGDTAVYTINLPPDAYYRSDIELREKVLRVSAIARKYAQLGVRYCLYVDENDRLVRLSWIAETKTAPSQAARAALIDYVNGPDSFPSWAVLYDVLADCGGLVPPPKKPRTKACA